MSPFWDNDWLSWDVTKTEEVDGSLGDVANLIYFQAYPAGESVTNNSFCNLEMPLA